MAVSPSGGMTSVVFRPAVADTRLAEVEDHHHSHLPHRL
jgi:hypothetical protein